MAPCIIMIFWRSAVHFLARKIISNVNKSSPPPTEQRSYFVTNESTYASTIAESLIGALPTEAQHLLAVYFRDRELTIVA